MRRITHKYALYLSLFALASVGTESHAGGTRIWELAGFSELNQGETDGTIVSSKGEVSLGYHKRKLDLSEIGLVWSAVQDKKGTIYLGSGYDGKIFRVRNGRVHLIADTGQLVVTSLVLDAKGALFAASLPDATIWKIDSPEKIDGNKPVEAKSWVTLPDEAEHVFALAFGVGTNTLFAGTGPEGKLYAVGRDKSVSVYLDTDEEHILSLLAQTPNSVVAGTSPGAKLLRVRGPGRVTALADFDGTEVLSIAKDGQDLVCAVNTFKTPPAIPKKSSSSSKGLGSASSSKKSSSKDKGKSKIYRIQSSGKQELLFEDSKSHVVSLAVSNGGELFVGFGNKGRVMGIDDERVTRTVLDLDERQVTAIIANDDLEFVATGDTGGAYGVRKAAKTEALYFSPPLDTETVSSWGRLQWHATSKLIVQSRSGNTKLPGKEWSDWSGPIAKGSVLGSPPARYLQLRFSFAKDPKARLISAELAFIGQNRRATITKFDPDSPFPKSSSSSTKYDNFVSERTAKAGKKSNEKELELTWSVDNPDDDDLRYSLWYRAMGEKLWRPITKDDEVLTKRRYTWKTESVPEGRYQLRLLADDTPDNDPKHSLSDEFISVPILVDNHPPVVKGLSHTRGTLKGSVKDTFSAVSHVEFSVDGGAWFPIFSKDRVFDEPNEEFEFDLPNTIKKGPHAIAVRAFDRAGNMGIAELHIIAKGN